jgi:hypothetical protein
MFVCFSKEAHTYSQNSCFLDDFDEERWDFYFASQREG